MNVSARMAMRYLKTIELAKMLTNALMTMKEPYVEI